ncbi:MAG: hypothetical protein HW419_2089 [Deltaproteobacteria bacterium]|nr:hypothetical protein [Deltaproteobacteria bacterium]
MALYFRCFDSYPIVVAANRDEHFDRPSAAPALLNGNPKIIAGKDLRAGGTWLGVNAAGLMVGILNRRINGDALPATVARSRGALCMELLQLSSAKAARRRIDTDRYRYHPFTIVFADQQNAYVAYNDEIKIITQALQPGLQVFSSAAEFDLNSAKAERAHERFASLMNPLSEISKQPREWLPALQNILSDHSLSAGSDNPGDAICVHREASGTVSASVMFLVQSESRFETFFCSGAPCQNVFNDALTLHLS